MVFNVIYFYLWERQTESERDWKHLDLPSSDLFSKYLLHLKLDLKVHWVSHMGGQGLRDLTQHQLLPRMHIGRKLM